MKRSTTSHTSVRLSTCLLSILISLIVFACNKSDKSAPEEATNTTTKKEIAAPAKTPTTTKVEATNANPGTGTPAAATPVPAKEPEISAETKKLASQSLSLLEDMSKVVATNAKDCDKMAVALTGFGNTNKSKIEEMKKAGADPGVQKQVQMAFMRSEFRPRFKAAVNILANDGKACQSNEAVQKAMLALQ